MKNTPASLDFNDRELSHGEEKKITSLSAMEHHVSEQKERLLEQVELLKKQLELINKREELAKLIYAAKYSFESEEHIRKRAEAQKKTKALKRKLKEEKFAHSAT